MFAPSVTSRRVLRRDRMRFGGVWSVFWVNQLLLSVFWPKSSAEKDLPLRMNSLCQCADVVRLNSP